MVCKIQTKLSQIFSPCTYQNVLLKYGMYLYRIFLHIQKQNTYQTSNFAFWYVNNHWTFLFAHKTYIPNCANNIWYVFATKRHKIFKNMHTKLFFFSSSCINFHFWGNYIYRDFFPLSVIASLQSKQSSEKPYIHWIAPRFAPRNDKYKFETNER